MENCEILIGTSGYSFKDWKGTFYPEKLQPKDYLEYYAQHFNIVEVNSSYYRIPPPRVYKSMMERTSPEFKFVVKIFQDLTHNDVWEESTIYYQKESIKPLCENNRLEGILCQFPWSFKNTESNRKRIIKIKETFPESPMIVEFRNENWINDAIFSFLQNNEISYCSVDMPQIKGLIPPVADATSKLGYVRWHGRNAETWWKGDRDERYNYNYSGEELKVWLKKLRKLAEKTDKILGFFNNCHMGNAAFNAKMMKEMLSEA